MELNFEYERRLVGFQWVGLGPDQGYRLWCEGERRGRRDGTEGGLGGRNGGMEGEEIKDEGRREKR